MGGTNGVGPHFFHHSHLPFGSAIIYRSAQRTQVVVHADSLKFHVFIVQEKSLVFIKTDISATKSGFIFIF
ncbi:hypothetical protein SDC9_190719 [bioreactor metagenome]|uniref:Uncharacterized protein n=1 Tax=bioreactor metagenome TaxID=1076179 RepID=A0A645HWC1_9ZZZZ